MIAEWNITQQDVGGRAPPTAPAAPNAAHAVSLLQKAGCTGDVTPDAASFWFKSGLVRVK